MTTEQKEKFLSNQNLSQKFTEEFAKWELNPAVTAISLSVSNFFTTVAVFYKTEEDAYFASEFVSVTMRLCFAAFSVDTDAGEWSETRIHTVTKDKDGWYSYVSYNGTEKICVNSTVQSEKMAAIMNSFMGIE
jgi:hypothetical protein